MADLEPIRQYFLQKIGGDRSLLPADSASLIDEGILDSFGLAELVASIEKSYGVKIPDKDIKLPNFDSVDKIGKYVDRLKTNK
ncbi:MAG: acyl carrier protein [Planctomycetes bacterium]|nr:acyl carrier protein [Planctomycetota bacterium]